MAGLIGVRIGHLYYVGKLDRTETAKAIKNWGKDFIVMKDAFELLVSHRAGERGMQVQLIPTWITPFESPVNGFTTRVDSYLDLSKVTEPGFLSMVRGMGGKGLIIPGLSVPA
jgi:hypothetical protein